MGIHGTWLAGRQAPDFRSSTAAERRGATFSYYLPAHLADQDVGALLDRDVREYALEVSAQVATTPAQVDEATRRRSTRCSCGRSPSPPRRSRGSTRPRGMCPSRSSANSRVTCTTTRRWRWPATSRRPARRSRPSPKSPEWGIPGRGAGPGEHGQRGGVNIHRALGVVGVSAGLRAVDVWIGGRDKVRADYVAPPPQHVPPLVEDLPVSERIRRNISLLLAAIAHVQFESIHPFEDGNGRSGRALIQRCSSVGEWSAPACCPSPR